MALTKKAFKAKVAKKIREARDLMNHGGKHWIVGAEKAKAIDGKIVAVIPSYAQRHLDAGEPSYKALYSRENGYVSQKEFDAADWSYCSIGALREACGDDLKVFDAAAEQLARVICGDEFDERLAETIADLKAEDAEDQRLDEEHTKLYGGKAWWKPRTDADFRRDAIEILQEDDFAPDNVVINFNDDQDPATGWANVRSAFTTAARRVSQRKSL